MFKKIFFFSLIIVSISLILIQKGEMHRGDFKQTSGLPLSGKSIMIDPGHGGFDPGVVGITGKNESELNLEIAKKLQEYFESSGAYVTLTRADQNGLYLEGEKNKKRTDMNARRQLINEKHNTIAISIHQNQFSSSQYSGSQVFYSSKSILSKTLASCIQKEMKELLNKENNREIKSADFYLLEKANIPVIIIECGFLSNLSEEKKLNENGYQELVAWAIYSGTVQYFDYIKNSLY